MNLSSVLVEAPTKAEADARSNEEKLWSDFDFFYESGEPITIKSPSGNTITFGNNFRAGAWNLIINFKIVLTSDDAEKIINTALEYY